MATISTTARPAFVYDEAEDTWFPVGIRSFVFIQNFEFTATASQTTFTGIDDRENTLSYAPESVGIYLNGVLLSSSTDYVATNGTSIILSIGAAEGDLLTVIHLGRPQSAEAENQQTIHPMFIIGGV